ncbi:hypothetical protein BSKO_06945 [Bryopsis sp. KO-2023]|nr:hypothetical protein BSKO_06945 [Bryopsis sp. KO-2023]
MEGVLDETVAAVTEMEGLCGKLKTELLTQFDETHKRLVEELKGNQEDREGILLEEIALLRVEHEQMRKTVGVLTSKNKELLIFKSKLDLERSNHEATRKEKQRLEEALAIAKCYRKNAAALEKERKDLCVQLDTLKKKLQAYGGDGCEPGVSPNQGLSDGISLDGEVGKNAILKLVQENEKLKESSRLREFECQKLKGECAEMKAHLNRGSGGKSREAVCSGAGSSLRHQVGKPSDVRLEVPSPAVTPCNFPRQTEKENYGSNERHQAQDSNLKWSSDRVEFYRGTLSTDIGSSKKRRVAEERERILEWGTQMESRRLNDGMATPRRTACQTTPCHRRRLSDENVTPRRQPHHQSASRAHRNSQNGSTPRATPRSTLRAGVEFDPTLPCTFAESLDLTQMTEPASPVPSEGAASTLNVEMEEENAELVFSPVRLSQNQPSLRGNDQAEMADPPQACEARRGVLGGRRLRGNRGQPGGGGGDGLNEAGNCVQGGQGGGRWNSRENNNIDEMDSELGGGAFDGVIDMTSQRPDGEPAAPPRLGDQVRPEAGFKYDEVVRKKADREMLPGFDCVDCRKFYQALSTWGHVGEAPACGHAVQTECAVGAGKVSGGNDAASLRNEASRHRNRHGIPHTPQGFWEMDFPNSVDSKNP